MQALITFPVLKCPVAPDRVRAVRLRAVRLRAESLGTVSPGTERLGAGMLRGVQKEELSVRRDGNGIGKDEPKHHAKAEVCQIKHKRPRSSSSWVLFGK